jgi:hypothetical protein
MDIFEIAKVGMKIQEEELKALSLEEEKKPNRLDIKAAIEAASCKDYDWYNRLGEDQKLFQPFMLNLWMGMIWTANGNRSFTGRDDCYAVTLRRVNSMMNTNVFCPKDLFWLIACTVQSEDFIKYQTDKKGNKRITDRLEYNLQWVKKSDRLAAEKYDFKVIKYIAQELYSSTDKIMDMIDNGLITAEEMKDISDDLETLELKKK